MKYMTFDKEQIVSVMIYCNKNDKETSEDIIKSLTDDVFIGKFNKDDHLSVTTPIKNDNDIYIMRSMYGYLYLWQVCGKISDYVGNVIPHLYRVRQIGILFD